VLQINVNGLAHLDASRPKNWGQLLDLLERGEGLSRQIVTAVRFGGVAMPTFREPGALGRQLEELGPIDVQTATVDELLHDSAQAAFDSVGPLRRATIRIAGRLRAGDEMARLRELPQITASVQTLTTVTAVLSKAKACVDAHRTDLEAAVARFCAIVDALTTNRERQDWPRVADVLERELAPTLDAWTLVARRVWKVD
jgi:hypothetical protein